MIAALAMELAGSSRRYIATAIAPTATPTRANHATTA